MEGLYRFVNKTEGRDKFCKAVQYASRFLKHTLKDSNPDIAAKAGGLFIGMRDARKLFRLFKTFQEYYKITQLLAKGQYDHSTILQLLTRGSMGIYWIFDNLQVLAVVKVLSLDSKKMGKYGSLFWFIGLVLTVVTSIIKLADLAEKEAGLKQKDQNADTKKAITDIKKQKFTEILNLIKSNGDMITASAGAEIAPKLGINFNDAHIGLGGFVSAVITMYQTY